MIAADPDRIWLSGHCGKEYCERIWCESEDSIEDCPSCGKSSVAYLLATSQRRAAPEMYDALIHARRIIIAACTANAPGFDPTEHNAVKEIDAALAKADGREPIIYVTIISPGQGYTSPPKT